MFKKKKKIKDITKSNPSKINFTFRFTGDIQINFFL